MKARPTKAKPAGSRKPRARKPKVEPIPAPPSAVLALGSPPTDPLAAEAWMHALMVAQLHDAAVDPKLTPALRRKEVRTIAASVAKLMPRARLYEAEQLIKSDRKSLDEAKARRVAKLEPRPKRGGPSSSGAAEPDAPQRS